uniref:Uncharacterized protein n=1 Tax=Pantoea phage Survivor TaxID=3232176 RepID=A0AAU8KXM0_9CAUD
MANKKIDLLKGQTKTLQCKAVYEGKNAIDKVMTLNDQMDLKDLIEPMGGELNPDEVHIDLFLKGHELGTGTISIPFGYNGKESGVEGVDINTVNVDVSVTAAQLNLVPQTNVFDYSVDGTYELLISINNGTDPIVLNDEGISFMESQALIDIVTVGPDRLMIKPNAGWEPVPGSIIGTLKVLYYGATVDVDYTFNVPEPRKLKAVVEGGTIATFATGTKKLTITDQNDAPVTDAAMVAVNISTENNSTGVYSSLADALTPLDAANGVYSFNYTAVCIGAKVTLAFKIASGNEEFDLNPVVLQFSQEPLTATVTNTPLAKTAKTGKVDVTVNMKRTKNGSPIPLTGYFVNPIGTPSTTVMKTTPALTSQYRIRTLELSNINTTSGQGVAYIITGSFISTEHNSGPIPIMIQITRVP